MLQDWVCQALVHSQKGTETPSPRVHKAQSPQLSLSELGSESWLSWTLRWLWPQLTLCLCPCQRPWAGQSSWATSDLSQRLWENTWCCKPGTLALFPVLCSKVGFFNLWGCLRVWLFQFSFWQQWHQWGLPMAETPCNSQMEKLPPGPVWCSISCSFYLTWNNDTLAHFSLIFKRSICIYSQQAGTIPTTNLNYF